MIAADKLLFPPCTYVYIPASNLRRVRVVSWQSGSMNQTYPRLIALGSRKRAERAALSRADGICPEWSRSIDRNWISARVPERLDSILHRPRFILQSTVIPPLTSEPSRRDSVFSLDTPRHVAPILHFSTYGIVRSGEAGEKVSPRPATKSTERMERRTTFREREREGFCGCKAVIRHNSETFSRYHFRVDVRGRRSVF